MKNFTYWFCSFWLLLLASCAYDNVEDLAPAVPCATPEVVSYELSVAPILDRNCRSCHNKLLLTGGVNLEDFTELQRRASTGQLMGVIRHDKGFAQMPKDGAKLVACDIEILRRWVEAGAPNN